MNNYLDVIKTAFIVFPLIALLISCPFILIEYHKFGSISVIKTLIIYSLVLYLICAYFLIILPLPSINEVSLLTTPQVQLMPGKFIIDFINNTSLNLTNFSTYIKSITESYFYVPIYNLLLTLPFGMYLRYYFKCNLKKTILFTFILSLFFELTQLSGLYYIYPRGYRLFDIDDLLLNTIGGIIGYLICGIFIKKLPAREEIDKKALEAGKKVSGLRRTTAFFLDLFLYSLLLFIIKSLLSEIKMEYASVATIFIYYVLIAFFLKGSTLGEKIINLKVADYNEKNNFFRLFLRIFSFIFFYAGLPFGTFYLVFNSGLVLSKVLEGILAVIFVGYIIIFYMITGVRFLFTNKDMLYERVSKTKMMSTIK